MDTVSICDIFEHINNLPFNLNVNYGTNIKDNSCLSIFSFIRSFIDLTVNVRYANCMSSNSIDFLHCRRISFNMRMEQKIFFHYFSSEMAIKAALRRSKNKALLTIYNMIYITTYIRICIRRHESRDTLHKIKDVRERRKKGKVVLIMPMLCRGHNHLMPINHMSIRIDL